MKNYRIEFSDKKRKTVTAKELSKLQKVTEFKVLHELTMDPHKEEKEIEDPNQIELF